MSKKVVIALLTQVVVWQDKIGASIVVTLGKECQRDDSRLVVLSCQNAQRYGSSICQPYQLEVWQPGSAPRLACLGLVARDGTQAAFVSVSGQGWDPGCG